MEVSQRDSVNKENVMKLVAGATAGMEVVMGVEPGQITAAEVVSAAVTLAARAIDFAVEAGRTPEECTANKLACRAAVQQLMLKTADNLKVF